uniref:RNA-dependent RNA polymerase n=1 Tax=Grapevine-associated mitovirus 2 TaxID=2814312 RepID=A0A8F5MJD5_9VIRU|nr:MAG: RNA-dependent RNA polymerase [Grapevine-associated mitovirus 2]
MQVLKVDTNKVKPLDGSFLRKNEFKQWVNTLLWLLPNTTYHSEIKQMSSKIFELWNSNGSKFTVFYLKECCLVIMKFIAKEPYISIPSGSTPSVSLSKDGLPAIIPLNIRDIMKIDFDFSKSILSLFNVFRVISFKGAEPDLKTITDPFNGISKTLDINEISRVILLLEKKVGKFKDIKTLQIRLEAIYTSGPNFRPSVVSSFFDAYALLKYPSVLFAIARLSWMQNGWWILISYWLVCIIIGLPLRLVLKSKTSLRIGKLAEKPEPAGKVRIFAIVDFFSQTVLKPLHENVGQILKQLETDGTYDQIAPLDRLLSLHPNGPYYSFDLKAATDRLPIEVQHQVITQIMGKTVADQWIIIASQRPWIYEKEDFSLSLNYSVGQPMGQYLSFPSLGITHHIIVQIAAQRAGIVGWFSDYALLGDDIVIYNSEVALHYVSIMRGLGVTISDAKTLRSNSVVEFAKRLRSSTYDYTPLGAKSILKAMKHSSYIPSALTDALNKGVKYPDFIDKLNSIRKTFRMTDLSYNQLISALVGPTGLLISNRNIIDPKDLNQLWSQILQLPSLPSNRVLISAVDIFQRWEKINKARLIYNRVADLKGKLIKDLEYLLIHCKSHYSSVTIVRLYHPHYYHLHSIKSSIYLKGDIRRLWIKILHLTGLFFSKLNRIILYCLALIIAEVFDSFFGMVKNDYAKVREFIDTEYLIISHPALEFPEDEWFIPIPTEELEWDPHYVRPYKGPHKSELLSDIIPLIQTDMKGPLDDDKTYKYVMDPKVITKISLERLEVFSEALEQAFFYERSFNDYPYPLEQRLVLHDLEKDNQFENQQDSSYLG